MGKESVLPLAGPSRHQNAKKTKKDAKPLVRTSKIKKLSEKQKIGALEQAALKYVRRNSRKFTYYALIMSIGCPRGPQTLCRSPNIRAHQKRSVKLPSTRTMIKGFGSRNEEGFLRGYDRNSANEYPSFVEGKGCPGRGADGQWENSCVLGSCPRNPIQTTVECCGWIGCSDCLADT